MVKAEKSRHARKVLQDIAFTFTFVSFGEHTLGRSVYLSLHCGHWYTALISRTQRHLATKIFGRYILNYRWETIMKRLFLTAIAVVALTAGASHAATFNFAANADGTDFTNTNNDVRTGGEADWATIVGGAAVGILDVPSGISVVGSGAGTNANGTTSLFAYFDSGSAGLGVCGNTGSCSPGNDDNVGAIGGSANAAQPSQTFETLTLTFNQGVTVSNILFAAEGHGAFTGDIKINGIDTSITGGSLDTNLFGTVFNFQYLPVPVGTNPAHTNEFYIEAITVSSVPVPAALPLLLAGVGGFAWVGRHRKAA
ncbi:MAG: VPLPA-CTERM sorting domain-containing protein [Roseobacter sp.]